MTGEGDDLLKLVHLAGVGSYSEMRIAQRCWDIRVTPSGRKIWSPRPISQRREKGSFQSTLGTVTHADVILVFKKFKLKLVAIALNSQLPTSCDEYLSEQDLGGKGCFIPVEPLYVAPIDQEDRDEYADEEGDEDEEAADSGKAVRFDESLSTIEQIRKAQASEIGLQLAHAELAAGRKQGGWERWVFPSLAGAVESGVRGRYRLTSPGDAAQILRDPELGASYLRSVALAWTQIVNSGLSASELMGSDAGSDELRSSLELFLEAWETLDPEEKALPEMNEFSSHAQQLLDYINPFL
jgi:uncharacterized protein (DUF1810 family)